MVRFLSLNELSIPWVYSMGRLFGTAGIRKVYPEGVDPILAYKLGLVVSEIIGNNGTAYIVHDTRITSPTLSLAIMSGFMAGGLEAGYIGLAPTPVAAYASLWHGVVGVSVTASHNPPEYNGFKLVREESRPISKITGIERIKKLVLANTSFLPNKKKGNVIKKNVLDDYSKFVFEGIQIKKIKPLRIVVDTANGVVGIVISQIFKKLPVQLYHLFPELDGRFPNHLPNPLVEENLEDIKQTVRKKKADLGVAFDGDGDRIIFVDEKGEVVPPDLIGVLVAESVLKRYPGQKIMYDIRSSNIVKEKIKEAGGVAIMSRVGHSFIKERMRKENIVFAQEFSGHYYFKDRYFAESPFFVLFKILERLSESKKKLSDIIKEYKKYYHSGEINFEVADKEKKIKELEKKFSKGKKTYLDGLRVDFKDWWFNVRPSNTEPLLRLVIEAKTKEVLEKKKKEISALIKK